MTNRLTWTADGATYSVERSEDGLDWEQIGTSASGSFLETNAGLGTQFYYRLTSGGTATAAVQGSVTGMAALKEIAVLFYEGNDSIAFDGSNKVAITKGISATEFGVEQTCTRAQIVTFLYRAYK